MLLVNFFIIGSVVRKLSGLISSINNFFSQTCLKVSWYLFTYLSAVCLQKISPFDWRYGWKCPHLLCTKYVFLTLVVDGRSAVCLQLSADCLDSHSSVALAEWFSGFHEKSLAFEVLLAKSAIEALAMIIVVESLDPSVASFDWESTRYTFGGEEFIPIFFAVG